LEVPLLFAGALPLVAVSGSQDGHMVTTGKRKDQLEGKRKAGERLDMLLL
jgi:hypothetical protein